MLLADNSEFIATPFCEMTDVIAVKHSSSGTKIENRS